MTGFGTAVCEKENYKISIEIKSVNNRYKDVSSHLPLGLRSLETIINDHLNKYSLRGKIDIYINFTDNTGDSNSLLIDKDLALAYYNALKELSTAINKPDKNIIPDSLSFSELIKFSAYPGILVKEDKFPNIKDLQSDFTKTFDTALELFIKMKLNEGKNLCKDILYRVEIIYKKTDQLCELAPAIVEKYRQNLVAALGEYLTANSIDQTRIIQETAIYAEKTNYTEETTRLKSHLTQFKETIQNGGNIGRKLDFIVQEMNREINTIASKANSAKAGQLVVDVKGEIEKIREQIQNIE
nr:YicC/YloC family endoribonuclease [Pectinatus sottacetonis]